MKQRKTHFFSYYLSYFNIVYIGHKKNKDASTQTLILSFFPLLRF
jgi:hypothetical protein